MRRLIAVGLFSCALLVTELTLMRLFSVTMLYHYAFLVLSFTLFGLGAGGVFHYVFDVFRRRATASLPWLGVASAAAIPVSVLLVFELPFDPYELSGVGVTMILLVVMFSIFPFFLLGLYLSLLYYQHKEIISRLYAADLVGAAIGCTSAVALFETFGATALPWMGSALVLGSALLMAERGQRQWIRPAAVVLVLLIWAGWWGDALRLRYVKGRTESDVEFEKWNAFSRIAVFDAGDRKVIQIDADAATEILSSDWIARKGQHLLDEITGMVYAIRSSGEALVVGPGGGRDLVAAHLAGMDRITAVEINPIIVEDVMLDRYREYSGGIYVKPGIDVVIDDARHFLERSDQRFDVIQANAVDTWAAVAGGGLTLSESYLYTLEAFHQYLGHLKPDGVLSIGRWVFEPPQQMIRVLVLALKAMEERGISGTGANIFLVTDPSVQGGGVVPGVVFVKKKPFTGEELAVFQDLCTRRGYRVLYSPVGSESNAFYELVNSNSVSAYVENYPFNIAPVTDDHPFFFLTTKWSNLTSLWKMPLEGRKNNFGLIALVVVSAVMAILTLFCFVLPLLVHRTTWLGASAASYFVGIGLAFMMLETVLIQRTILFLGHPSLAFVAVVFFLLCFSGLGSFLSARVPDIEVPRFQARVLACLAALLILMCLFLSHWLFWGARFAWPLRLVWLGIPLMPLGLLLGQLFPLGLRRVSKLDLPWAWGLNGAASVLGSSLAVLIAILAGFRWVLWTVLLIYLLVSASAKRLPAP